MAKPVGGASRLVIALTVAVAATLILGSVDASLAATGVHMLPPPLNVLLCLGLVTVIITLTQVWQGNRHREDLASVRAELQAFRLEQDVRDGRIYAALARRSGEITVETPRPRVVASVPAVGLDSRVMDIGSRIARRLADDAG